MRKIVCYLVVGSSWMASLRGFAAAPPPLAGFTRENAVEIMKSAEKIRCLDQAEVDVTLTNEQDKKKTIYDLNILRSSSRRAFVDFRAPDEERGRKMLAVDRNYWSKFPDSKRVVAISRREMIGNSAFAIADLFQLDAEADFDPTVVAKEQCDKVACLKLYLKAKHDEAPYAEVYYWVEEKGYFPLKAEFYGDSSKKLKTMIVESRRPIAGMVRPELARMIDAVTEGHFSLWKTRKMEPRNIPDQVFTKDYLGRK